MAKFLICLAASAALVAPVLGQAAPPVSNDYGVTAHAFDISQITLDSSARFQENEVMIHRILHIAASTET